MERKVLAGGVASDVLGPGGVESAQNQPMTTARMVNQLREIAGLEMETPVLQKSRCLLIVVALWKNR